MPSLVLKYVLETSVGGGGEGENGKDAYSLLYWPEPLLKNLGGASTAATPGKLNCGV